MTPLSVTLTVEREISTVDLHYPDGRVLDVDGTATVEIPLHPEALDVSGPVTADTVGPWCGFADHPVSVRVVEANPAYSGPDALFPGLTPPETVTRTIAVTS